MLGFAELPERIATLAAEHDQLAVVLLDAFGWAFVQRHADHPFLRRLEIEPAASQFPSTTTAHLTTLYSGLPVTEHGLYEWRCYEPLVGDVIRPLRFALADSDAAAADHAAAAVPVAEHRRGRDGAAAGGDRGHAVRLGGARGRDDPAVRDDRGRRGAARSAGADVPVLGRDRRHRPSPRTVERGVRPRVAAGAGRAGEREHAAARHRRPRPDRRRQDGPPRPVLVGAAAPPHAPARGLRA